MKVLVVGASRGTGAAAVAELVRDGHEVTAFARTASAQSEDVRTVTGDVFDPDALGKAMIDQEAVVVILGISDNPFGVRLFRRARTPLDVRSEGTRRVVDAMWDHGIRRLVVQTTYGLGDTFGQLSLPLKLFFRLVLAPQLADSEAQETVVRGSDLDWTIIRPVSLTDGSSGGDETPAHVDVDDRIEDLRVTRRQVGRVHADALRHDDWFGATVSVSG
ncbi:NAD(P)-dependent oxidoreductase [Rhodococcus gannanensis]|uniref:NAD(P)-dependent oxidoreductase n=1 Tax=Rhodococcus gannanensis TaxID=1960308 RepID=A0ABW4P5E5_9NOCA